MLNPTFRVLSVLAFACLATPASIQPAVDYGNANFYIDLVLYSVNSQLPDTIPLPDLGGPFHMKNCYFFGLEQGIRRDGDATLVMVDRTMKFAATFKIENTGMKCDWKFGLLHGTASASTAKVDIASSMTWLLAHNQHPWLTEFLVTTLEPVKVDIKGLTFAFNWLAEDISEWIIGAFEDEITYVIEHQVRDAFQLALNTIVIP